MHVAYVLRVCVCVSSHVMPWSGHAALGGTMSTCISHCLGLHRPVLDGRGVVSEGCRTRNTPVFATSSAVLLPSPSCLEEAPAWAIHKDKTVVKLARGLLARAGRPGRDRERHHPHAVAVSVALE